MKRYFILLTALITILNVNAERFSDKNSQGLLLWYSTLTDSTAMITGSRTDITPDTDFDTLNYSYITADTIIVPEYATNGSKRYKVVQTAPYGVFNFIESVTTIYLPKTIELIGDTMTYSEMSEEIHEMLDYDVNFAFSGSPNLQNIYIDEQNPNYTSVDGVLYTKDLKTIITCPPGRTEEKSLTIDGCKHIGRCAYYNCTNIKKIDFPNSVKTIGNLAYGNVRGLETLYIKDSVEYIGNRALFVGQNRYVKSLYIGTGLKRVTAFMAFPAGEITYCFAKTPPQGNIPYYSKGVLYVPQKSINEYKKDPRWGKYGTILPIEPPIVTGVNEIEVYWAQSFSATNYVWILYLDEEMTQKFITLTFDSNGHLTNIDFNKSNAPQQVTDDNDDENHFKEYYSFTITGLDANTKYYYTRQTLAGERVIDEETGSFETLPDGAPTGVNPLLFEPQPQKTFENGMLRIRKNGNTYNVNGTRVE